MRYSGEEGAGDGKGAQYLLIGPPCLPAKRVECDGLELRRHDRMSPDRDSTNARISLLSSSRIVSIVGAVEKTLSMKVREQLVDVSFPEIQQFLIFIPCSLQLSEERSVLGMAIPLTFFQRSVR